MSALTPLGIGSTAGFVLAVDYIDVENLALEDLRQSQRLVMNANTVQSAIPPLAGRLWVSADPDIQSIGRDLSRRNNLCVQPPIDIKRHFRGLMIIYACDLEDVLREQADDLGDLGADNTYGWGMVNAMAAYDELQQRMERGDLDGDGDVNVSDLALFCSHWLNTCPQETLCPGDVNLDNQVNLPDYHILHENYGLQFGIGNAITNWAQVARKSRISPMQVWLAR